MDYCAHIEMQTQKPGKVIKDKNFLMCFWKGENFWWLQVSKNLTVYFNTYKSNNSFLCDKFQAKISVQV